MGGAEIQTIERIFDFLFLTYGVKIRKVTDVTRKLMRCDPHVCVVQLNVQPFVLVTNEGEAWRVEVVTIGVCLI